MATPAPSARLQPNLNDLGDDILLAVLRRVRFQERHSTAALVCRRWARLVLSPSLLRCIYVWEEWIDRPHKLQLFCVWLLRHAAGSLRQLHVSLSDPTSQVLNSGPQMLQAMLAMAAACCRPGGSSGDAQGASGSAAGGHSNGGAANQAPGSSSSSASTHVGGLQELFLTLNDFDEGWELLPAVAASLAGLRVLHIDATHGGFVTVSGSLTALSALQELRVKAEHVELTDCAVLPPSLTRLRLDSLQSVPPQVLSLTGLSNAYVCLARLGGTLERLDLHWPEGLPSLATLAALPRLRALHLTLGVLRGNDLVADLPVVLGALGGQLEELSVLFVEGVFEHSMDATAGALGGMRCLRRLRIEGFSQDMSRRQRGNLWLPIPAGAPLWAALQRLALPGNAAVPLADALLAGATQLEWLGLFDADPEWPQQQEFMCTAVARLPRLRRLCVASHRRHFPAVCAAAAAHRVDFVSFQHSPNATCTPDKDVGGFWAAAFEG